MFVTMEI